MKKTIKLIDLLNKIANGEEVPKRIIFDTRQYYRVNSHTYVRNIIGGITLVLHNEYNLLNCLNYEVEIIEDVSMVTLPGSEYLKLIGKPTKYEPYNQIEEDKKIEKLDLSEYIEGTGVMTLIAKRIENKINKIIDEVNKLKEKE